MKNNKKNVVDKFKIITVSLLVVSLILNCVLVATTININSRVNSLEELFPETIIQSLKDSGAIGDEPSSDSVEAALGRLITDENELNDTFDMLVRDTENLKYNPYYIPMYNGSDEEPESVIMYNSNGESVAQGNGGSYTVNMREGKTCYFGDYILYGEDADVLSQVLYALDIAERGLGELRINTEAYESTEDAEYVEYCVDIKGWQNIELMLTELSNEYAKNMCDSVKETLTNALEGQDIDNTNIRFGFVYGNGQLLSIGNYFYFGENSPGLWSNCFVNWNLEGWMKVYDYDLSEEWYSFDYTVLDNGGGTEELSTMLDTLIGEIEANLVQFDIDNGGDGDIFESSESTEVTEDSESSAGIEDDNTDTNLDESEGSEESSEDTENSEE